MGKKIALYIILGILILALVLFTIFPGMTYVIKDFGKQGSLEDICAPAPGYTEESWREHMGHHPNIYSDCLK